MLAVYRRKVIHASVRNPAGNPVFYEQFAPVDISFYLTTSARMLVYGGYFNT
jgi:hypothetical protein